MSLRQAIRTARIQAMKKRHDEELSILRVLWSTVENAEIEKKEELKDEEIQELVARQVKQLSEALVDFEKAGREDLIKKTKFEIDLLRSYLPAQLAEEELKLIVEKVIADLGASGPQDMGKVMSLVMKEIKGRADGGRVKELVIQGLR